VADYRVARVPLHQALDRVQVEGRDVQIADVAVLYLPSEAVGKVFLHFGDGEGIPLYLMGQAFSRVPPQNDGIYVSMPQPVGVLELQLLLGTTVRVPRS